jgi:hypothetical protein
MGILLKYASGVNPEACSEPGPRELGVDAVIVFPDGIVVDVGDIMYTSLKTSLPSSGKQNQGTKRN